MPRPRKTRYITTEPGTRILVPGDVENPAEEPIKLEWDEYEAVRLVDYEGLFQDAAGDFLGVSRQTVGRILVEGRRKLIGGMVEGRAIEIEGGDAEMMVHYKCGDCSNDWLMYYGSKPSRHCPACGGQNVSVVQPSSQPYDERGGRRRKWMDQFHGRGHGKGRGGRCGRGRRPNLQNRDSNGAD